MGGVGIRAMGRLMERVMAQVDLDAKNADDVTEREIRRVAGACHWTEGTWDVNGLPWNELQNTPRHISALSNFLVRHYVGARATQR